MIKRFHSNLYYASDLEQTAVFYRQLGFDVQASGDGVRVKMGDFTIAFVDENKTPIREESGAKPKGLGIFTYVEVEDVDVYFETLRGNGVRVSSEPRTWPWGKREFVVKDPDGYKFVFYSAVKS